MVRLAEVELSGHPKGFLQQIYEELMHSLVLASKNYAVPNKNISRKKKQQLSSVLLMSDSSKTRRKIFHYVIFSNYLPDCRIEMEDSLHGSWHAHTNGWR